MRAIVVGGGIGGLAAVIALRQAGCDALVIEQGRAFAEVGAGIQMAPNATKVLRRLGLLADVERVAVRPAHLSFRRWSDGAEIARNVQGPALEERFGAPYLQVHRADLHRALADAIPAASLRLGARVVDFGQDDDAAWVDLADGDTLRADVVVAADGIRSAARQQLFGRDDVVFSGTAAYRATLPADDVADLDLPDNASWLGPDRHFVNYWVRSGTLLNVVAVVRSPEASESWSEQARPGEAEAAFEGWDPRVTAVLARARTVFRWGIFTRTPLERWTQGRITLLGDSAHAMVPFQAQGAAQAIQDAAVLGMELRRTSSVPDALAAYEDRRRPPATAMQRRSANAGDRFHLPDGPAAAARDAELRASMQTSPFGPQSAMWDADVYAEVQGS